MRRFGRSFDTLAVGIFSRMRLAREPSSGGDLGARANSRPFVRPPDMLEPPGACTPAFFFAPRTVRRLPVPAGLLLISSSGASDPVVRGSQGMRLRSLVDALAWPACPVVPGVLGRSTAVARHAFSAGGSVCCSGAEAERATDKNLSRSTCCYIIQYLASARGCGHWSNHASRFLVPPSRRLCCRCCPLAASLADRSIFLKGAGARSDNAPPTTWFYAAPEGCVGSCRARLSPRGVQHGMIRETCIATGRKEKLAVIFLPSFPGHSPQATSLTHPAFQQCSKV